MYELFRFRNGNFAMNRKRDSERVANAELSDYMTINVTRRDKSLTRREIEAFFLSAKWDGRKLCNRVTFNY